MVRAAQKYRVHGSSFKHLPSCRVWAEHATGLILASCPRSVITHILQPACPAFASQICKFKLQHCFVINLKVVTTYLQYSFQNHMSKRRYFSHWFHRVLSSPLPFHDFPPSTVDCLVFPGSECGMTEQVNMIGPHSVKAESLWYFSWQKTTHFPVFPWPLRLNTLNWFN